MALELSGNQFVFLGILNAKGLDTTDEPIGSYYHELVLCSTQGVLLENRMAWPNGLSATPPYLYMSTILTTNAWQSPSQFDGSERSTSVAFSTERSLWWHCMQSTDKQSRCSHAW